MPDEEDDDAYRELERVFGEDPVARAARLRQKNVHSNKPGHSQSIPRTPIECELCGAATLNLGQHIRSGCESYIVDEAAEDAADADDDDDDDDGDGDVLDGLAMRAEQEKKRRSDE